MGLIDPWDDSAWPAHIVGRSTGTLMWWWELRCRDVSLWPDAQAPGMRVFVSRIQRSGGWIAGTEWSGTLRARKTLVDAALALTEAPLPDGFPAEADGAGMMHTAALLMGGLAVWCGEDLPGGHTPETFAAALAGMRALYF